MKKAITTRFKITKKGNLLRRKKGISHFKLNKSASQLQKKKKYTNVNNSMKKLVLKKPQNL